MTFKINRRQTTLNFSLALAAMLLAPADAPGSEDAAPNLKFGKGEPFSFHRLRQHARSLAQSPYVKPVPPAPAVVGTIDYDMDQKIKFRPEYAFRRNERFPIRFFHPDRFNDQSVKLYAVSGGEARQILFSKDCFDYDGTGLVPKIPDDLGFAGFRVMNGPKNETDWLAFEGASYFRSAGQQNQYGASARGIAINSALSTAEEFPRFSKFWFGAATRDAVSIYALLEGPSLTGAYSFIATRRNAVVMDVHAEVFVRADIQRFGIAPLTSMYWYGENERDKAVDWRPEIHDSDCLVMWTGKGEHICRPLIDPPTLLVNSFADDGPKGFGLMQRDRNFDHYQDDSAFYDRRPSIWVEPRGNWGKGAVQLVEIPTDDEIHDNIVAYWLPAGPVTRGTSHVLDYRLYWQDYAPKMPGDFGRVVSTRIGRGGVPGRSLPQDKHKRKFVIDFEGGPLTHMAARYDVTPVVTIPRGKVSDAYVIKVVGTDRWRALFDVALVDKEPLDMRCYLRLGGKPMTETWLYQYFPAGS